MQQDIQNKSSVSTTQFIAGHIYQSPLPPPEILAKYKQADEDFVKKVIQLTEEQAAHRRALDFAFLEVEIQEQKRSYSEARMGQIFAFIIAMAAIMGGAYVAVQGYQTAGSIISALGLTGIVSAFITGRPEKNKTQNLAPSNKK
jgi:uncharacterized membrane protein